MAERKVSKKVLAKASRIWLHFANAGYSWIRLMGNSYAQMMVPVVHDLYPDDKAKRNEVIARSMDFYNTEPNLGAVICGIAISMEEQIANGDENVTGDDILAIRTALMGPLAGIGDTLLGTLNSIYLALCVEITLNGAYVIGPLLYVLLRLGTVYGLGKFSFYYGYRKGGEAVMEIISQGIFDKVISMCNVIACGTMGALMCQYVKVTTPIKFTTGSGVSFNLQSSLFDALMPSILPLCFTLFCFWLISKKRVSVTWLLVIIVAIAAVLGPLGILG